MKTFLIALVILTLGLPLTPILASVAGATTPARDATTSSLAGKGGGEEAAAHHQQLAESQTTPRAGTPVTNSGVRYTLGSRFCATLSGISWTAWICGSLFIWLFYRLLVRRFTVNALLSALREEERMELSGIPQAVNLHHPALLAIRKWSAAPDSPVERAYRWLDSQIATVFGSLLSQGESLRTLSLNVSFGATIMAFIIATSGGHDIDRMLSEVSGALGATLFGLFLFTIESWTLSKLNEEVVRLEYEGREMIDAWLAQNAHALPESHRTALRSNL